jgi:hypothetical protein
LPHWIHYCWRKVHRRNARWSLAAMTIGFL